MWTWLQLVQLGGINTAPKREKHFGGVQQVLSIRAWLQLAQCEWLTPLFQGNNSIFGVQHALLKTIEEQEVSVKKYTSYADSLITARETYYLELERYETVMQDVLPVVFGKMEEIIEDGIVIDVKLIQSIKFS